MSEFEAHRNRLAEMQEGLQSDGSEEEESRAILDNETLELASDCMAFVEALWQAMGQPEDEPPDLSKMEALYDAYQGELAAAAMFFSENTWSRLPDMLRGVSAQLEKKNDGSVPTVMVKGFRRFAARIEHTRLKQAQVVGALREIEADVAKST